MTIQHPDTGRSTTYRRQKDGTFHVDNAKHVKAMLDDGAGGSCFMPTVRVGTRRGWVCDCGWVAVINHCPHCDRTDLQREE